MPDVGAGTTHAALASRTNGADDSWSAACRKPAQA